MLKKNQHPVTNFNLRNSMPTNNNKEEELVRQIVNKPFKSVQPPKIIKRLMTFLTSPAPLPQVPLTMRALECPSPTGAPHHGILCYLMRPLPLCSFAAIYHHRRRRKKALDMVDRSQFTDRKRSGLKITHIQSDGLGQKI